MKKIIAALSFFLVFSNAHSNNSNSRFFLKKNIVVITDTTENCNLITNSKSKYSDVYISGLSDSSVNISNDEYSKEILIKDIKSITFKGSGFWKGVAIGGGIGLLTGILLGASNTEICDGQNGCAGQFTAIVGLVFAIPSALIGGGLGVLLAKDKIYDLSNLDFEAKRKKVKNIIKEYSDR